MDRINASDFNARCLSILDTEHGPDTGLHVGQVPGFPGAHGQGEALEERNDNLNEVIALTLHEGAPAMEGELVGT